MVPGDQEAAVHPTDLDEDCEGQSTEQHAVRDPLRPDPEDPQMREAASDTFRVSETGSAPNPTSITILPVERCEREGDAVLSRQRLDQEASRDQEHQPVDRHRDGKRHHIVDMGRRRAGEGDEIDERAQRVPDPVDGGVDPLLAATVCVRRPRLVRWLGPLQIAAGLTNAIDLHSGGIMSAR